MRSSLAPNRLEQLGPGHDACLLYESELERNAAMLAHLRTGLARDERLVLLAETTVVDAVLADLTLADLPVDVLQRERRLVVVRAEEEGLIGADLGALDLVDLLEEAADRAGADQRGVRVAADLSWGAASTLSAATVNRYQARISRFASDRPAACLIAFDSRRVSPISLLRVMAAHPLVARGTELFANLYFFPAEDIDDDARAEATLRHRLETIEVHKRDLQNLRESEELYNSIVESMDDGVVVIDRDFRYVYWNPAMERIFAIVPQSQGQARPGPPLHHTTRGMDAMIVQAMVGRTVRREDIPRRLADGSTIHTNEVYVPLRELDGSIRGVVGIVRDVSGLRAREDRLRRKRGLLARIMADIPAAMVVVDRAGGVLFANPRGEELLGLCSADSAASPGVPAPAWPLTDAAGALLSAADLPFNRVLATGEALEAVPLAVRRPDGSSQQVLVDASPIHDEAGAVDVVLLTCRTDGAGPAPPRESHTEG